jgi:cobalt-precorrin 5A hydrolase
VQAVDVALEKVHVPLSRLHAIATADAQTDSQPIVDAAAKLHAQLEFLNAEDLPPSDADVSEAAVNQEKTNTGATSERVALFLAGSNAKLILKKTKLDGVTIAIAEAE